MIEERLGKARKIVQGGAVYVAVVNKADMRAIGTLDVVACAGVMRVVGAGGDREQHGHAERFQGECEEH